MLRSLEQISPTGPKTVLSSPWFLLILLGAGLAVAAYAGGSWTPADRMRYGAALLAGLLTLLPAVRRMVLWILDRLRDPNPRGARVITLVLALLAANYFIFTGMRQGRELIPKYHDEHVYLIQAHMVAQGHLWMPALPLPEFLETFYLFVKPVYAGVYFPGTAAAYAPCIWLNVPPWAWAALICGGCVGMLYRVFLDLTDGVWAMLAALLLLALPAMHLLSLMVMSHPVSLLLGLLMTWSYLQWRRRQQIGWAALIGFFAGWAAITRPLDALCFAIPICIAMSLEARRLKARKFLLTVGTGLLAAAPFILVQLMLDHAVTGHALLTPVTLWDHRYAPQWTVGPPHAYSDFRPASQFPRMQLFYEQFILPGVSDVLREGVVRVWFHKRLPLALQTVVPAALLLVLLPLGLPGMRERQRWVVLLGLPLFVALYMLYPPFLNHYALAAAPAVLLLIVTGARTALKLFSRYPTSASAVAAAVLATTAFMSLTELNPRLTDPKFETPLLDHVDQKLSEINRPAVVLFHYDPGNDIHEEPVYNSDVAWPDDAPVIRAHDLGERNVELFRYYASRSPRRMIYLYDESTLELRELGMASALAPARR